MTTQRAVLLSASGAFEIVPVPEGAETVERNGGLYIGRSVGKVTATLRKVHIWKRTKLMDSARRPIFVLSRTAIREAQQSLLREA